MTLAQSAWLPVNFTHAAIVTAAGSSAAVRLTRTESFTPSKVNPLPVWPGPNVGPFWSRPVLLLRDESAAVVPPADSNCQYAKRPDWNGSGVAVVVNVKSPPVAKLPDASRDST